jgi:hypothetical protein
MTNSSAKKVREAVLPMRRKQFIYTSVDRESAGPPLIMEIIAHDKYK